MGNQLLLAQAGVDVGPGAFQDFLYLPGQAVSLVEAANLRIAIARAQQAGKLAVAAPVRPACWAPGPRRTADGADPRPGSTEPAYFPARRCAGFQTAPSPWRCPAASAAPDQTGGWRCQTFASTDAAVVPRPSALPTGRGKLRAPGRQAIRACDRLSKRLRSNRAK